MAVTVAAGETPNTVLSYFSVVECLIAPAGHVVPKRELLDHVWDVDFAGPPNIVEVYIRRLRRKVDEPFGNNSIQTVGGVGYRRRWCPRQDSKPATRLKTPML